MKADSIGWLYESGLKPLLFQMDPERMHGCATSVGSMLGDGGWSRWLTSSMFEYTNSKLNVEVAGVKLVNPVGLSAGFDYDGKMSGILPRVGFGYESIGTVTRNPYEGNKKPRLGRLPKSGSLLVNKGFKSEGIEKVLSDRIVMTDSQFGYGISIGATNSPDISTAKAQKKDILESFDYLVKHPLAESFSYYELNISCPNVAGSGSLANEKDLDDILRKINKLSLKKPLWVKFQLEIDWKDAKKLVRIMIKHKVAAVIMSNLLKNRESGYLEKDELKEVENLKGNFSGRPTWELSNELIGKTYKEFGNKIAIVGVGGIFSAEDAYTKIGLGAGLVQLITGMVYKGPQLIGQINQGLVERLEKDGFKNISEAVGSRL